MAGQLVRDVHPNAVFIELDRQRVDKVAQYIRQQQYLKDPNTPPIMMTFIAPAPASAVAEQGKAPWWQPRSLFRRLRNFALNLCARVVASAKARVYQNLEDQGFSPGDGFVTAVMGAQKQGADAILGDQDIGVTMKSLTQALWTDISQLDNRADALSAMDRRTAGIIDVSSKEELTKILEGMKHREFVRALNTERKKYSPLVAQVMLTERDKYMAGYLDQFQCIVAVMGIFHMDGVS